MPISILMSRNSFLKVLIRKQNLSFIAGMSSNLLPPKNERKFQAMMGNMWIECESITHGAYDDKIALWLVTP